ncbi:hypothetical protein F9U64_01060 [Gracilibacillus oryzae]|uniref:Excalibur calcium-binding domain-containing protein n=1 Tax=Gracilibacillus oryzae TaxID=1672701 RepID=A0A7C8L6B3_9BACI|nr:hypothetical protein F9U64_01060 [Gracilibacillus oryzae]
MKKLLNALIALVMISTFSGISVSAADGVSILINGEKQYYDQPPIVQDGRTLVPLRGIFEALGADVGWDAKNRVVTAEKDDIDIWLKIGSKYTKVNGQTVTIDVPAQIKNARTLVPLRFVSESLGADVGWNASTRTVDITYNGEVIATYDVTLHFPVSEYPETAAHIEEAIANGESAICTIDRNGADENRNDSLAGIPTRDGYDRDEFPMAMCEEGGEGASVKYVEPSDNRGAGAWVGNQLEQYPDGTRVLFVLDGDPVEVVVPPVTTPVVEEGNNSGYNGPYNPNGADRDCGDFNSHEEAQAFFEAAGPGDPHRLDGDGNGLACESL